MTNAAASEDVTGARVMVAVCFIAVCWQFGHPWIGVVVVLAVVGLLGVPALLAWPVILILWLAGLILVIPRAMFRSIRAAIRTVKESR